jgi:hypothetical protein
MVGVVATVVVVRGVVVTVVVVRAVVVGVVATVVVVMLSETHWQSTTIMVN